MGGKSSKSVTPSTEVAATVAESQPADELSADEVFWLVDLFGTMSEEDKALAKTVTSQELYGVLKGKTIAAKCTVYVTGVLSAIGVTDDVVSGVAALMNTDENFASYLGCLSYITATLPKSLRAKFWTSPSSKFLVGGLSCEDPQLACKFMISLIAALRDITDAADLRSAICEVNLRSKCVKDLAPVVLIAAFADRVAMTCTTPGMEALFLEHTRQAFNNDWEQFGFATFGTLINEFMVASFASEAVDTRVLDLIKSVELSECTRMINQTTEDDNGETIVAAFVCEFLRRLTTTKDAYVRCAETPAILAGFIALVKACDESPSPTTIALMEEIKDGMVKEPGVNGDAVISLLQTTPYFNWCPT